MNILFWIGLALIVIWAFAWIVFGMAGFLVHLLLIVGIVLLVVGLLQRPRGTTGPDRPRGPTV